MGKIPSLRQRLDRLTPFVAERNRDEAYDLLLLSMRNANTATRYLFPIPPIG